MLFRSERDFDHRRWRFPGGRMEYVCFTPRWIEALERLAAGEDAGDRTGEEPLDG